MMPIAPLLIANTAIKLLDLATTKVQKLSTERGEFEAAAPTFTGQADNHPDNIYSTVKVNGEVVATLYKGGSVMMTNAAYARAQNLPSMSEKEMLTGVPLAEKRTAEIAKALGGTIEKASPSSTASSPMPMMVKFETDPALVQSYRNAAAQTRFNAHLLAQNMRDDAKA